MTHQLLHGVIIPVGQSRLEIEGDSRYNITFTKIGWVICTPNGMSVVKSDTQTKATRILKQLFTTDLRS